MSENENVGEIAEGCRFNRTFAYAWGGLRSNTFCFQKFNLTELGVASRYVLCFQASLPKYREVKKNSIAHKIFVKDNMNCER